LEDFEAAEKLQDCHPEGRVCPRDLLFPWKLRKSRSLSSLGVTTKPTFFRSLFCLGNSPTSSLCNRTTYRVL
jgi:hypothetical protein